MSYADRLHAAVLARGNPCLVGLDPHLDLLPEPFAAVRDPETPRDRRASLLGDFLIEVLDVAAGRVPAVKPQSAFFEVFGADGAQAWERVVRTARSAGLIVIGDVKRGDIASTAKAYATAYLEGLPGLDRESLCDAITVNPFLGSDAVLPIVESCARAGAGAYVLVRTSNPGGAEFQRHGRPQLSELVADAVTRWGAELVGDCGLSSIGAVVGATHTEELAEWRALLPRTPFLLPGYGAQGAGAADVAPGFLFSPDGRAHGALVNASRSICFAWRDPRHAGKHWKDACREALDEMIGEVRGALDGAAPGRSAE